MGIKPSGTTPIIVPQDNVQSRWGAWEADLDTAGQQAGEVFAETHAIATSANSVAATAAERAQGYITAAENVTAELAGEIDPEHPDYLLWALANQVDKATQQALRAHSEAISANDIAVQALTRTSALMATVRYGEAYVGEHFVASWNGTTVTISKRGEWVGEVTVLGTVGTSTGSEEGHTHSYVNHFRRTWLPTDSSGSYLLRIDTDVTILYQIKPGIPRSRSIDSPGLRTLANGVWETLAQWVVSNDTQVSASGSFVWANKTYLGGYSARLTLDGVPVTTGEVASGAPIFGHGARTHQVSMRPRSASRNAVLRLEARAEHSTALNRQVRDVNLTMHWVGQDGGDVETVAITGTSGTESRDQFRKALADRGFHYSTITEVPFDLDTSGAISMQDMFRGCAALTSAPTMDTSQVTNMVGMFQACAALTSVPDMETSQVTNMGSMFHSCVALTDGNVRLIGRHPNVVTYFMLSNSGLTREPFFDAAGNPI